MNDLTKIISKKDTKKLKTFIDESFTKPLAPNDEATLYVGAATAYLQMVNAINESYSQALTEAIDALQFLNEASKTVDERFETLKAKQAPKQTN